MSPTMSALTQMLICMGIAVLWCRDTAWKRMGRLRRLIVLLWLASGTATYFGLFISVLSWLALVLQAAGLGVIVVLLVNGDDDGGPRGGRRASISLKRPRALARGIPARRPASAR